MRIPPGVKSPEGLAFLSQSPQDFTPGISAFPSNPPPTLRDSGLGAVNTCTGTGVRRHEEEKDNYFPLLVYLKYREIPVSENDESNVMATCLPIETKKSCEESENDMLT